MVKLEESVAWRPAETIADTVSPRPGERALLLRIAWGMAGAALVAIAAVLIAPLFPRSLAARARQIVRLPADARIIEVDDGLGSHFGDVYFSVPEPAGPGSQKEAIWTGAGMPARYAPLAMGVSAVPASHPGSKSSIKKVALPGRPYKPGMGKPAVVTRGGVMRPFSGPLPMGTRELHGKLDYNDGQSRITLEYLRKAGCYRFRRLPMPDVTPD